VGVVWIMPLWPWYSQWGFIWISLVTCSNEIIWYIWAVTCLSSVIRKIRQYINMGYKRNHRKNYTLPTLQLMLLHFISGPQHCVGVLLNIILGFAEDKHTFSSDPWSLHWYDVVHIGSIRTFGEAYCLRLQSLFLNCPEPYKLLVTSLQSITSQKTLMSSTLLKNWKL
jgi:hypothetical protein